MAGVEVHGRGAKRVRVGATSFRLEHNGKFTETTAGYFG